MCADDTEQSIKYRCPETQNKLCISYGHIHQQSI